MAEVMFMKQIFTIMKMVQYLYYKREDLSLLRKGSRSRRLWELPPIPSERYERRPCLFMFVARFGRRIFL